MFSHRAVLGWLFVVLVAAITAITFFLHKPSIATHQPLPARSPSEIQRAWSEGVKNALTIYERHQDATATRDLLLGLSVRAEDQATHLGLVLALQELIDHRAGATVAWEKARGFFAKQGVSQ